MFINVYNSSWLSVIDLLHKGFSKSLKKLSNSGKFFSKESAVLTLPKFFLYLVHLTF